jgi:hypothetical protein
MHQTVDEEYRMSTPPRRTPKLAPGHRTVTPFANVAGVIIVASLLCSGAARGAEPVGRVDHSAYDALLKRYVDSRGLVNYRAWKADDRQTLTAYLAALSSVNPDRLTARRERLAFWINAYNALTIDAILHFYPVKSIKDKVSRLFGYNVWDDYPLEVAGRAYSLNDIEHKVLRPMGEPRIHFAIVCASIGCPKLRTDAYTGARIDAQLDDNARDFFASAQRFRIDRQARTVYLSPILSWFGEDFGGTDEKKLAFVQPFVADGDRAFLGTPGLAIAYLTYDWSLNEQS